MVIVSQNNNNNSNNYLLVFTDTQIKYNSTYGNASHYVDYKSRLSVFLNITQSLRNGTIRIFAKIKSPSNEAFVTVLNRTIDWCYFVDHPFAEPFAYAVYEQAMKDKRNNVIGNCPILPV